MGKHLPHETRNLSVLLRLRVEVGQTQFYQGALWPLHPHCGTCSPNNNKSTVFLNQVLGKTRTLCREDEPPQYTEHILRGCLKRSPLTRS